MRGVWLAARGTRSIPNGWLTALARHLHYKERALPLFANRPHDNRYSIHSQSHEAGRGHKQPDAIPSPIPIPIPSPIANQRPITPAAPSPAAATYLSSEVSQYTTSMSQKKNRTICLTGSKCMLRWSCRVGNGPTPDRTPAECDGPVKTEGDSQLNTNPAPIL